MCEEVALFWRLRSQPTGLQRNEEWMNQPPPPHTLTFDLCVEVNILNSNFLVLVSRLMLHAMNNKTPWQFHTHHNQSSLTNVNSCFLFVSCQDPDLDVCLHQCLNSFRHLILKLVLYGCGPQQLQVLHSKWARNTKKRGEKVNKRQLQQRKAFKTSSVKETCVPGLCHSLSHVFPLISCSCLSHRKTTTGF